MAWQPLDSEQRPPVSVSRCIVHSVVRADDALFELPRVSPRLQKERTSETRAARLAAGNRGVDREHAGMLPQTLATRLEQAERDAGKRAGLTTDERAHGAEEPRARLRPEGEHPSTAGPEERRHACPHAVLVGPASFVLAAVLVGETGLRGGGAREAADAARASAGLIGERTDGALATVRVDLA